MSLQQLFVSHGVNPGKAYEAVTALGENPTLQGIVVSGKIAAGKDTLAPLILRHLDPYNELVQVQFAFFLKNEVSDVINIIRANSDATDAEVAEQVCVSQNIKFSDALTLINFIRDEIRQGIGPKDGWDKTPGNRLALQYWGTEIRRTQSANYFVDRAVEAVVDHFIAGRSVFVTDARFSNELEGMAELGFHSFRIDVSPEEQRRRFFKREGTELAHKATLHPSETSLDDYEGFDSRVLTDGMDPADAAAALVAPFVKIP